VPNTPPQFVAGGDIHPCRFLKVSTAADFTALEAGANEQIIGISGEGSNYPPLSDLTVSDHHAVAGQPVDVHGDGDVCLLELGGTVARGDRLKADSAGKGVVIASTGTTIQQIGAVALQSGVSSEKIRVQVMALRSERPALT
jgi:hypothetical protein